MTVPLFQAPPPPEPRFDVAELDEIINRQEIVVEGARGNLVGCQRALERAEDWYSRTRQRIDQDTVTDAARRVGEEQDRLFFLDNLLAIALAYRDVVADR